MTSASNHILQARTALLWDSPFFGVLSMHLLEVDATDDPTVDTMATDGKHLFYDSKFVLSLSKAEMIFVLAHEIMHNALEHHLRRQNRNPGLWNVACDFAINLELTKAFEEAKGVKPKMPAGGLIDAQFEGMSAEEIYRHLQQEIEQNGHAMAGGVKIEPEPGPDLGGCGGIKDACDPSDEAAVNHARAELQAQVRGAAMAAEGAQAGSLPGSIQRLIDRLLQPKVDWRAILRKFIDGVATRDYAWSTPNRRLIPHRIITPSLVSDSISHLVVAVDTSGSINGEILNAFAAEIRAAFGDGAVDRMSVLYADAKVQHVEEFEAGDELDLHPKGGGGTAFSDTFRMIRDRYQTGVATIYLTDLFVCDYGDEPDMPVLWAVHGRTKDFDNLSVPFGELVNISD
ncbi:putative metal-dependent peptidase [Peteryoungia aggregata LMG 23059]|uniref:Metal-dependent peptidase n=1 Tax=Peteryoungia aggregata LMG 23059 TaxID=1368425 RepID=A0ABU0GAD9_9HYPH|nr:VWA-like domain-containing protein [Peteryoungia aggregata]MDQ0422327.1 putative metal-dependent peptidase [Peteryoungia aggregata LMG 23059]